MNCLQWNMYWDFGSGQIGDMGSHTMDLLWNAIDAELPTSAEAKGEPFNPDVTPVECESHFEHPGQRLARPHPRELVSGRRHAPLAEAVHRPEEDRPRRHVQGPKGFLVADFDSRDPAAVRRRRRPDLLQAAHARKACCRRWATSRSNGSTPARTNLKTACDFEYSGNMIEQMLLGLVAYRVGKKIEYDGATGRVTNCPEANELLSRKYRAGWTLNG